MAQITINIPQYKLRSFLSFTRKLGIGKSIRTSDKMTSALVTEQNMREVKKRISPFLLFDWEFFSNELEFE
jgi:hypothetical protein